MSQKQHTQGDVEQKRKGADHDEHQVGQASERFVLTKGLDQSGDVLLGVWPAHGQDSGLVRVPEEFADLLYKSN